MGKHSLAAGPSLATQSRHPWRAVVRTVFAALVALAAMAAPIYSAATNNSPEAATGWAAVALAIAGGVTRVLALPQVDEFLHRFAPWLATGENFADEAGE